MLCDNSSWRNLGRPEIINNLSTKRLTNYEQEALSFGLKFATGAQGRHALADTINANYKSSNSDFQNGFVQGILASSMTEKDHLSLPRRYISALKRLSRDENVIITTSDKGGGIVILNQTDYDSKMNELLQDEHTYEETNQRTAIKEYEHFNKEIRRIFKKHDAKDWNPHIENNPKIPTIYGLPKTHKENIPLRPIVSGLHSAPHKIARKLAKTLTPLLGTISTAHIKHSGDLLDRLQNINITRNKKLASLDVKSLYTNIPVKHCIDKIHAHLENKNIPTPSP